MTDFFISVATQGRNTTKGDTLALKKLADVLEHQTRINPDTHKGQDWKVYPFSASVYAGKDPANYTGTGALLIDIDSKAVYDRIRDIQVEIFESIPSIIAMWPSFSKKLHIAVLAPALINMTGKALADEYMHQYTLFMSRFVEVYEELTGQCVYDTTEDGTLVCDTHNACIGQAMYCNLIDEYFVNGKEYTFDEYVAFMSEIANRESEYRVKYPLLWEKKKLTTKEKKEMARAEKLEGRQESELAVVELNKQADGKFFVNRDFCLYGYRGHEARFRIAKAVLQLCNEDMRDAEENIREHITNAEEVINEHLHYVNGDKRKVVDEVTVWVRQNIVRVYVPDEVVMLADDEYVSAYKSEIIQHIREGKNVYIKADCGTGKSELFRQIFDAENRCVIIAHMLSVRDGVFGNHSYDKYIISTKQIKRLIRRDEQLPAKAVVVWNTIAELKMCDEYADKLRAYTLLFDESHTLAASLDYRHETIYNIVSNGSLKHSIFATATPVGEHILLGHDCMKYEFRKVNNKSVTYTYMYMSDADGQLENTERKKYDYLSTIVKLVEERYDDYDAFYVLDNRGHLMLREKFADYSFDFCRAEADKNSPLVQQVIECNQMPRKIMVTTSYGVEGIEVKGISEEHYDFKVGEFVEENTEIKRVCAIFPIWNLKTQTVTQGINRFRDVEQVDVIFVTSDDCRELCYGSTGQAISLDYMSDYKYDDDINDEIQGYVEGRYYADTSTNYSRGRLQSETDTVLALSRLQFNNKRFDSITSNNIQTMYPTIRMQPRVYVSAAENERDNRALDTLHRLVAEHYQILFNYDPCEQLLQELCENYSVPIEDSTFYARAVVKKEIHDIFEHLMNIEYFACDCDSKMEKTQRFRNGLKKLARMCANKQRGVSFQMLKYMLKVRYNLIQHEHYLDEIGDNQPQRERNETDSRRFNNFIKTYNLPHDLSMPNYNWVCEIGENVDINHNPVGIVCRDSRNRTRVKKYKFARIDDPDIKYARKEEAWRELCPDMPRQSFDRRGWQKYLVKLS